MRGALTAGLPLGVQVRQVGVELALPYRLATALVQGVGARAIPDGPAVEYQLPKDGGDSQPLAPKLLDPLVDLAALLAGALPDQELTARAGKGALPRPGWHCGRWRLRQPTKVSLHTTQIALNELPGALQQVSAICDLNCCRRDLAGALGVLGAEVSRYHLHARMLHEPRRERGRRPV